MITPTKREIRSTNQAVARGAKLLDKVFPGWHRKIGIKALGYSDEISNQLETTLVPGRKLFEELVPHAKGKGLYPVLEGFTPEIDGEYYGFYVGDAILDDTHVIAWCNEVRTRRATAKAGAKKGPKPPKCAPTRARSTRRRTTAAGSPTTIEMSV